MEDWYQQLIDGDTSIIEHIVEKWIARIRQMSQFYRDAPVLIEDVIQEGSLALWLALGELPVELRAADMEDYLTRAVKDGMENYIRQAGREADYEQAIVAKAALLYEAQKQLAEENGEMPSLRQLSDFTHIPAEEIRDIFALYKNGEKED